MTRLLKDPLTHFLVLGALIFAAHAMLAEREAPNSDDDTIVVDERALLRFIQFRSRAFNEELFREQLSSMSAEALQLLIDDYVREEVLYREALKLGMDEDDYIIRRRLVQKMEFLADTGARMGAVLNERDLQAYFESNRKRYYVEPHATFTHVFFDADRRGWEQAESLASGWIADHANAPPAFEDAVNYGDRFPFHLNYVERVPELVAAHFGDEAAGRIFECALGTWHGPLRSSYGFHLVLVTAREEGRFPALDEVRDRVHEDAVAERRNTLADDGITDIIHSYDVRVEYGRDAGPPS